MDKITRALFEGLILSKSQGMISSGNNPIFDNFSPALKQAIRIRLSQDPLLIIRLA